MKKLFVVSIAFIFLISCSKEDQLSGTFSYSGIDSNTQVHGYKNENGTAIELSESTFDISLFDGIEKVYQIDHMEFNDSEVNYTAFELYGNDENSHIESCFEDV